MSELLVYAAFAVGMFVIRLRSDTGPIMIYHTALAAFAALMFIATVAEGFLEVREFRGSGAAFNGFLGPFLATAALSFILAAAAFTWGSAALADIVPVLP